MGSVLDVVNGALGSIFHHNDDSESDSTDYEFDVDNPATRLLETISKSSLGVIRASVRALNITTPEIESNRQETLENLISTTATPGNLRNLAKLLLNFIETVPRSTLDSSGILPAIPRVISAINDLGRTFDATKLRSLIAMIEDMIRRLVINFQNLSTLRKLPHSLIYLSEEMLDSWDGIVSRAQPLSEINNQTQVAPLSDLINSLSVIVSSVPIILQSVQSTMTNAQLELDRTSAEVVTSIRLAVQRALQELQGMLEQATGSLTKITQIISEDMNDAVAYNELAVSQSLALADQLTGQAGNLLIGQIRATLEALQRSSKPTVGVLISQLNTLVNATEASVSKGLAIRSDSLVAVFDRVASTIKSQVIDGSFEDRSVGDCFNVTLKGVEEISGNAVISLGDCAARAVSETVQFIDEALDQADDQLMSIAHLADKLEDCANFRNSTSSLVQIQINACLQSAFTHIRQSPVLNQLSRMQSESTKKVNSMQEAINSCVYQGLRDAKNAASVLEMTVDGFVREFRG